MGDYAKDLAVLAEQLSKKIDLLNAADKNLGIVDSEISMSVISNGTVTHHKFADTVEMAEFILATAKGDDNG
jgi:hypothetical protein